MYREQPSCRPWPSGTEQIDLLATREESTGLRHLFPALTVSAETPGDGSNSNHGSAHDGGVQPPVRGLSVPASGGRPDFLGVSAQARRLVTTQEPKDGAEKDIRDLAASTHLDWANSDVGEKRTWAMARCKKRGSGRDEAELAVDVPPRAPRR